MDIVTVFLDFIIHKILVLYSAPSKSWPKNYVGWNLQLFREPPPYNFKAAKFFPLLNTRYIIFEQKL